MRSKKLLAAAVLAIAASGAQAENLVTNGSFEANLQDAGTWAIYANLAGWTGGPGGIELRNNVAGIAQHGNNYVELDTTTNSSMSQSFTGGGLYELSFWYSAREGIPAGSNGLDFSFGSLTGHVLYGVAGATSGHLWQHYTGLVTLSGSELTTLKFSAAESSDKLGGSLDNISVTAVPEPETYAMLLAGLGLMGTIARLRKNSPV